MENMSVSVPNSYKFGFIGSPDAYMSSSTRKDFMKKYKKEKDELLGKSIQPKNQYAYREDTFEISNSLFIVDFDAVDGLSINDLLSYYQKSKYPGYYSTPISEDGYLFFVMWDELSLPLCHLPHSFQDECVYHENFLKKTKCRGRYLCLFDIHTVDDFDQTINELVASQLLKECDNLSVTNVRRATAFIDRYIGNSGPVYTKKP